MQVQSGETPGGSPCHSPTGLGVPGSLTHFSACLSKVALPQVLEPALPPGAEVAHLAEQKVQVSQTSGLGNLCLLRLPKSARSASGLQEKQPSWLRKRLQRSLRPAGLTPRTLAPASELSPGCLELPATWQALLF